MSRRCFSPKMPPDCWACKASVVKLRRWRTGCGSTPWRYAPALATGSGSTPRRWSGGQSVANRGQSASVNRRRYTDFNFSYTLYTVLLRCIPQVYLFPVFVYFVPGFSLKGIPTSWQPWRQLHALVVLCNYVKVFRNGGAGATTFLRFHAIVSRFSEMVAPALQRFAEIMQLC